MKTTTAGRERVAEQLRRGVPIYPHVAQELLDDLNEMIAAHGPLPVAAIFGLRVIADERVPPSEIWVGTKNGMDDLKAVVRVINAGRGGT